MSLGISRWPAFAIPAFRRYWFGRFASVFAVQITSVAVGWQVYDITRDPLDLGFVGLIQFLPSPLLVLVTGQAADRFGRRNIMAVSIAVEALCVAVLAWLTFRGLDSVAPIFAILLLFGIARAFYGPAANSLIANLVPTKELPGAVALNTASWQIATIVGPVAGGLLYGLAAPAAYGGALGLLVLATGLVLLVPRPQKRDLPPKVDWSTVLAGFRYIGSNRVVLGAISLDLFAVLLGGATALLPVYARDILELGPWGLGMLRAAPGVGAISVALYLASRPIRDRAGTVLFVFVAAFGFSTAVFGLSSVVWLSIVALVLVGATDMVSVYVRETLIQVWTPDAVRGRVNAVNMVFIGASNELGEFRAGVMAAWTSAVFAVTFGGLGTMAVAGLWARWFPELRAIRTLDGAGRK